MLPTVPVPVIVGIVVLMRAPSTGVRTVGVVESAAAAHTASAMIAFI